MDQFLELKWFSKQPTALTAWRYGRRIRLLEQKTRARIPPGFEFF
jgi:hypothetical protein